MCVFCCVLFYPGTELNVFWLPGPCFAHHSCDLQSPFDSPRGVWVSLSRALWVSHFGMSQSFHRPTLPLARVFPTLADGAEHPLATLRGFSFLTTRADTPFPFTLSQDGLVFGCCLQMLHLGCPVSTCHACVYMLHQAGNVHWVLSFSFHNSQRRLYYPILSHKQLRNQAHLL